MDPYLPPWTIGIVKTVGGGERMILLTKTSQKPTTRYRYVLGSRSESTHVMREIITNVLNASPEVLLLSMVLFLNSHNCLETILFDLRPLHPTTQLGLD